MRLVRIQSSEGPLLARVDGDEITVLTAQDPIAALAAHGDRAGSEADRHRLDDVELMAPITPKKIIAIGLNYRDHAEEQGLEIPLRPLIFAKFPTSVTGPFGQVVKLRETSQLDYEGELGVVIGKAGRNIDANDALDYVAGLTVVNDVSARDAQFADEQWVRGKSFDSFCPFGPWVTTLDEAGDPGNLEISTRVNGELRQHSNTRHLIFPVPKLVEYCSTHFTLEPGDLILTGTPGGVGFSLSPPQYLATGDVVEVEISGLGQIRNEVVEVDQPRITRDEER